MVTSYDEKGKIFTQVVNKHPVSVVVQTELNLIRGIYHVRSNARVKDEINGPDRFIALTNVVVYNNQKEELYQAPFLLINSEHIIWLIPDE